MLERASLESSVTTALSRSPAVAPVGPRQVGKTTLARSLLGAAPTSSSPNWFDLEDQQVEAQLAEPMVALKGPRGLVVIDEVQRAPDLFKVLRVLIDRPDNAARFLLLGSAAPALLRQSSESLAGRIEVIEAGGFTLDETGANHAAALWWRGGFPRSFTAAGDEASRSWRREFIRTVIERDLPELGLNVAAPAMTRFWATHAGAELDPLMLKDGRRVGVEFKRSDAPQLTPSIRVALRDLELDVLYVVYPGDRRYSSAQRVEAVPLAALLPLRRPLAGGSDGGEQRRRVGVSLQSPAGIT